MRRKMLLVGAVVVWSALLLGASGLEASSRGSEACAVRWRVVATGAKVPLLSAVAAISPTDVWAVGGYEDAEAQTATPAIMHWDGNTLRRYVGFKPSGRNGNLTAVAAVSADDVWAVGFEGGVTSRSVVIHWDGRGWKRVTAPRVGEHRVLRGIAAFASNDVWAVGSDGGGALSLHWDGRTREWPLGRQDGDG